MTKEQKTGRFLSITTLLAVLSLAGGMLAWANGLVERVVTIEEQEKYKLLMVQRLDVEHDQDIAALTVRFDRLENILRQIETRDGMTARRLDVLIDRLETLNTSRAN